MGVFALFIGTYNTSTSPPKRHWLAQAIAAKMPKQHRVMTTDTVAYVGARIKPKGVLNLHVDSKHKQAFLRFYVTDTSDTPLLGREACVRFNLVRKVETLARQDPPRTKEDLLQCYADVFKGLGEFPGVHHIHIDPTVPAVVHGCRKIPFAVDSLKETLDVQKQRGVCRKVTKPTPWVSSLVITEKKN